jgi:hypothetical protein
VGQTTTINSYGGISGYAGDYGFPLAGVFLSSSEPQFPPPATLVFSTNSVGGNFTSLFPAIGQVFFIGDGKTDGNITQTFYAPSGATRLYLGFPDSPDFAGDPGNYFDNYGSLSIQVKIGKFHTK